MENWDLDQTIYILKSDSVKESSDFIECPCSSTEIILDYSLSPIEPYIWIDFDDSTYL